MRIIPKGRGSWQSRFRPRRGRRETTRRAAKRARARKGGAPSQESARGDVRNEDGASSPQSRKKEGRRKGRRDIGITARGSGIIRPGAGKCHAETNQQLWRFLSKTSGRRREKN